MEDIEHIKALTLKLVRDKGVKQSEIYRGIRETLLEASEPLPKVPVLYNNSYGGFDTSEYFDEYVTEISKIQHSDDGEDYRISMARLIPQFGLHITEKYPDLLESVAILIGSDIEKILYHADMIRYYMGMIKRIERNKQNLEQHLQVVKMSKSHSMSDKKPDKYSLINTCCHWWAFDVKQLEDFNATFNVRGLIDEYREEMKKHENNSNWMDLPFDVKTVIMDYVNSELPSTTPGRSEAFGITVPSAFMDLFVKQTPMTIDAAWDAQRFFKSLTCRILFYIKSFHQDVYYYFKSRVSITSDHVYNTVGLLAASGKAQLAVCYIPALVDWQILHDDGRETVNVI